MKDSAGNEILKGDLIRMSHFILNKKKYFMYMVAGDMVTLPNGTECLEMYHLKNALSNGANKKYDFLMHEGEHECVVVWREKFHDDPELNELKRNKEVSD